MIADRWTKEEDAVLKRLWPEMTATLLGERLGRSKSAVTGRAKRLGMKK